MNRTMFIGTDLYYSQEFVDDRISELKEADKEIERLNNRVKQLEKSIMISNKKHSFMTKDNIKLRTIINELNNAYCKVITKCEEMINSRFYMNDIAIKKYADEIKDICRYYVGKTKELKGSDKE